MARDNVEKQRVNFMSCYLLTEIGSNADIVLRWIYRAPSLLPASSLLDFEKPTVIAHHCQFLAKTDSDRTLIVQPTLIFGSSLSVHIIVGFN